MFDKAFENLAAIQSDFANFVSENKHITEADTRINLIDRIIKEVLLWPPDDIQREKHVDSGYMDYSLKVNGKLFVCIEAKKSGSSFQLPQDKVRRHYKIKGGLSSSPDIITAINQARDYCDEAGIRYGIVTNGDTWIIFRAIREDMPWRDGSAKIFSSLEEISKNFIEFWNLFSFGAINNGGLDREFSTTSISNRTFYRVVDDVHQPDLPLRRNSLHTELNPVIQRFFEDIADPNYLETLQNCYVYSNSVKSTVNDMSFVIQDAIPKFLEDEGAIGLKQFGQGDSNFGLAMQGSVMQNRGQLYLLLGGIGSGKSTFQKRYQFIVGKETLDKYSVWFSIDFLHPPQLHDLENFVWRNLLTQLRDRYTSPRLETRKNIKRVFRADIEALKHTELYGLSENSPEYEARLNKFLSQWQQNLSEYVPGILSLAKPKQQLAVVLFFDNVDQLSPNFQAEIFLMAQRVTEQLKSVTIIALREESYYSASVQKVFNAYINKKFHIPSPPFKKMIRQRIDYAIEVMREANGGPSKFNDLRTLRQKIGIMDFLKIVEISIFQKNKNISSCIEHLCFGNMRAALTMFSTFLSSGATDVEKMLKIYRRDGNYFVAFHEFLRSIMLGERVYYKERYSQIMNLFECGQEKNSSHFTSVRILKILDLHRLVSSKEGEGFYTITDLISNFEDAFDNKEDFLKSLNRLVIRQLVETNTKIFDTIQGSTHVRITSSGWYYLNFLISSFAYLDLIFQDTPIEDENTFRTLVKSVNEVDNLKDPEVDKTERLEERFRRVNTFLTYLQKQEDVEQEKFNKNNNPSPIFHVFINDIRKSLNSQTEWISKRLRENREKYAEDNYNLKKEQFYAIQIDEEEDSDNAV
jgi:hypothetical protein